MWYYDNNIMLSNDKLTSYQDHAKNLISSKILIADAPGLP